MAIVDMPIGLCLDDTIVHTRLATAASRLHLEDSKRGKDAGGDE